MQGTGGSTPGDSLPEVEVAQVPPGREPRTMRHPAVVVVLALVLASLGAMLVWRLKAPSVATDPLPPIPTGSISITNPVPKAFAHDDFERPPVRNGLGRAKRGGDWTVDADAVDLPDYAADGHTGVFRLSQPRLRRTAYLNAVQRTSTDVTATFTVDKLAVGGPIYVSLIGRRVGNGLSYVADLKIDERNLILLSVTGFLTGSNAEGETLTEFQPGIRPLRAGDTLSLRMQVYGTWPAVIRVKTWHAEEPEPAGWLEIRNRARRLQEAGAIGFSAYLSGLADNAPVTVRLHEIVARPVVA